MKKSIVLFLLSFFVCISFGAAQEPVEDYNKYLSLDLAFSLSSGIDISPTGGPQKVSSLQADLSFFPKDDVLQSVSNVQTNADPTAKTTITETYTTYKWQNPPIGALSFGIDANVKTKNDIAKIRKNIQFPIQNLDNTFLEYTKPTKFIDLNPAIEQHANSIIGAETNLYKVVFKLADWTKNNIKYDLNTLTAEAVQKSSWVLENREGVCDEMTNLFISLLRSVGVPARFVSGMVYTNLDHQWGPHGWAEVYLPEYGWIPFDVTFGQYGWIDPSHIKLKESLDSGSPSAEYSWQATGVEVKLQELEPSVRLLKTGDAFASPLTLNIAPIKDNVGPGSFVPILVTVTNNADYTVIAQIIIKKAPELEGDNVQEVFLNPKETKTIGWIATIPENLEKNYVYTSTLEVASAFGDSSTSKVVYAAEYPVYKKKDAEAVLFNLEKQEEKKPLTTVTLSCTPDQKMYYKNETAKIQCDVQNSGSSALDIKICARAECQTTVLQSNEKKQITFLLASPTNGRIPITAETEEGITSSYIELTAIALPELYVTNLKPAKIQYKDDSTIAFDLNADSPVKDVKVDLVFGTLDLASFQGAQQITIDTNGKSLFLQGLKFTVTFTDEKGEQHTQNLAIPLTIEEVPWYAKFARWLRDLF